MKSWEGSGLSLAKFKEGLAGAGFMHESARFSLTIENLDCEVAQAGAEDLEQKFREKFIEGADGKIAGEDVNVALAKCEVVHSRRLLSSRRLLGATPSILRFEVKKSAGIGADELSELLPIAATRTAKAMEGDDGLMTACAGAVALSVSD